MSIIGEKKKVANDVGEQRSSAMRITQGSFSKVRHSSRTCRTGEEVWQANKWYFCREWFQQESQGVTRLLYSHSKHQTEDVARFIRKVENKLKLKDKSRIGPTQRSTISWIKVVPFWTKTSMRRSFFTMMLRCSQNYDWVENNFEEALLSIRYTSNTEYAVRRFLKGNVRYTGKTTGWYDEFKYRSKEKIDRLLVKPKLIGAVDEQKTSFR